MWRPKHSYSTSHGPRLPRMTAEQEKAEKERAKAQKKADAEFSTRVYRFSGCNGNPPGSVSGADLLDEHRREMLQKMEVGQVIDWDCCDHYGQVERIK